MNISPEWAVFCLIVPGCIIGFAYFFGARDSFNQQDQNWGEFASQNNLTFKFNRLFNKMNVAGRYEGRDLEIQSLRAIPSPRFEKRERLSTLSF